MHNRVITRAAPGKSADLLRLMDLRRKTREAKIILVTWSDTLHSILDVDIFIRVEYQCSIKLYVTISVEKLRRTELEKILATLGRFGC